MLTEINGTIKIVDDDKVVLEIAQNDLEKFKEYKHSADPKKFYAVFSLNDRQLYVTGFFTETEENQKDTTVTMLIASANKVANAKASTFSANIKVLLGLDNEKKEVKVQMLKHPREQIEELKSKIQELEDTKQKAEQENTDLKAEVEKLKAINSTVLQQQLKDKDKEINTLNAQIEEQKRQVDTLAEEKAKVEELNIKINTLNAQIEEQKQQVDTLAEEKAKIDELNARVQKLQKDEAEFEAKISTSNADVDKLKAELEAKEKEIAQLKQQQPNADVKKLEDEKGKLTAKIQQLETQIKDSQNSTEKDGKIKTLQDKVTELEKEKEDLEAKNKTTEQPKQGNGARYTAAVGMGLAAGLIAFTALERTVRLNMLVMIGIAVASALAIGGVTYAVLPSTQVNGAKAQEVNENGKGNNKEK